MGTLLVIAAIGFLLASYGGGGPTGPSSYTELRGGVRSFTNETRARVLEAMRGFSIQPAPMPAADLKAAKVAVFMLIPKVQSTASAEEAIALAVSKKFVVAASVTLPPALDGLSPPGAHFLAIAPPSARALVAGPTSPFAVLVDA